MQDDVPEIIERLKEAHTRGLRPAFAYDRVSAEVQADGVSLEHQGAGAEKYATDNELFITHSFRVVESASKVGRRVFNRMIDLALRLGVRDLIFKNTDRMSRNYSDLVRIDRLIDEESFRVHFHQTGLIVHRDSSYNDRFLIGIQLAVAKHLSDKLSQDIRGANLYKAKKGVAPGHSPYGYKFDRKEKRHYIDRETEPVCRCIFDEFDKGGHSLDRFVEHLNAKGITTSTGKPWRKGLLHRMLTNPFYHGEFFFRDRVWPGNHEPYYERARYEARIERFGDAFIGKKKRTDDFAFSGLVRCKCGRTLTGQRKKDRYVYYTHECAHTGKFEYLRQEDLVAGIDRALEEIRYTPEFAENLKILVRHVAEEQRRSGESELDALNARTKELHSRKLRLYDLYVEEEIDLDAVRERLAAITAEIRRLDSHRALSDRGHDKLIASVCGTIDQLRDAPDAAILAEADIKAELLREVLDAVEVGNGNASEPVALIWKKPHAFLMESELIRERSFRDTLQPVEANGRVTGGLLLWTRVDSNYRPLPYQRSALTN